MNINDESDSDGYYDDEDEGGPESPPNLDDKKAEAQKLEEAKIKA